MFDSILIANRGEIACRIATTAKRMSIRTVAVYSDADESSLHVSLCDDAVRIGENSAQQSYLNIENLLQAAKLSAAEAIHPGYGFLSENAAFAKLCEERQIKFIGPSAEAIRIMGSKSEARKTVQASGIVTVPGYDGDRQAAAVLLEKAAEIGYPCLIKAVSGGGGKGMRIVNDESEFKSALQSVQRESRSAFSDDSVLLEKYIPESRHIEVQIFGDDHGNFVHLFDRDCSLQRRHQKVIEEAPAPQLNEEIRKRMTRSAIACAKSVSYSGAGTVEFLYTPADDFYFMEMNTRLQVEHPVTEMITGVDLVEWQIRIAAGECLPLQQEEIVCQGHAMEARIYAENPENHFLPSTGTIQVLVQPERNSGVRIDTGIREGDTISEHYDPMISKLIVHASTRDNARSELIRCLTGAVILGVRNNIDFLRSLAKEYSFTDEGVKKGQLNTQLIDQKKAGFKALQSDHKTAVQLAIAYRYLSEIRSQLTTVQTGTEPTSPWLSIPACHSGAGYPYRMNEIIGGESKPVQFRFNRNTFEFLNSKLILHAKMISDHCLHYKFNEKCEVAWLVNKNAETELHFDGQYHRIQLIDPLDPNQITRNKVAGDGSLFSPMPGMITDIMVAEGDRVVQDQNLMILEAMKMEHRIQSPFSGIVKSISHIKGDQVEEGEALIEIHP